MPLRPLPIFNPDAMPHRPPMRLVDALLEAGVAEMAGDDSAHEAHAQPLPHGITAFQIPPGNLFVDSTGAFAREALVEVMAQAFMAVSVHLAEQAGERVPGGYLVGLRGVRFSETPGEADSIRVCGDAGGDASAARVGDTLLAQVRATDQIAQVAIVQGRIFRAENGHEIREENLLAEGELRLYTLPAEASSLPTA